MALRSDYNAARLRSLARRAKDGPQTRRLLALAAIYDGGTRTEAAHIGGEAPGQPSILSQEHRQHLIQMIEDGPVPAVHGVVRWRLVDLMQWLWEEYQITISKQTLSREVRALDYRKLSARPRHHAQSAGVMDDFKKASPRVWRRSRPARPVASR